MPPTEPQALELKQLNALLREKVDELQKTEAALRESEERYALAVQGSRDGLWDWNVVTNEVYYSPRFKAIIGYEEDEIAHEFSEFESRLHPDDRERILAAVQNHLNQKVPYDVDYRLRTKQGNYCWIRARGQAIWNDAQQPIRMAGSISDITDRKQTEAQIHEVTQRLALATDSANIGVWDYAPIENRLIWDEQMYALYGITASTFGGAYEAWQQGVHPEDLPKAHATLQEALAGKGEFHPEFRVVWPDGQVRFIEAHAIVLRDEGGRARRMIGVNWDITERKQMDAQLKQSLKELADVKFALDQSSIVAITDARGRITEVNDRFCAIAEYNRSELIGKTHRLVNSGHHSSDFFQTMWQAITSGKVWQGEIKNRAKGGSYYWVDTTIVPILGPLGKPIQFVAIRNDITDRKQVEEALRQLNDDLEMQVKARTKEVEIRAKELERSNAELQQFAYVASHDLQEPLRTISSFTELLAQEYGDRLDGEAEEYIEFITDGALRMQQLIKDLLAYSRVNSRGKAFAPTDCEKVIKRVIGNLKFAIAESQAIVTHEPLPEIFADESQIQQLFQNLISNALKFRGEKPPQVHISVVSQCHAQAKQDEEHDPTSENQAPLRFCVSDNGIGIEPAYREQIFEIFQRLHSRRIYAGTGIGLAICRKIVQRHGGRIWVEESPEKGAAFHFTLSSQREMDSLPC
ncbi:MAG: PAS domain-containing protein [Cyanobacteria bacterium P01_F01_bin.53]